MAEVPVDRGWAWMVVLGIISFQVWLYNRSISNRLILYFCKLGEFVTISGNYKTFFHTGAHLVYFFLVGGFKSLGIFFLEFQAVYGGSRAMTALLMGLVSGGMSILCQFTISSFENLKMFIHVLFIMEHSFKSRISLRKIKMMTLREPS